VQTQFSARVGGGAFMNETIKLPLTIRPQPLESLQSCLFGIECQYDVYSHS
jgi:hypothetical protein